MIAALVAACAWFNRMAGGGWPSGVRDGYWDGFFGRIACSIYVGLAAALVHAWPVALAFGCGFLFWRSFSWGWLIGAIAGGHKPTARPIPSFVEGHLLESYGPYLGMFLRMLFVLPGLVAVAWLTGNLWAPALAIPFAGLCVAAYAFSWRLTPNRTIENAEWAVGALWGALIVLAEPRI